MPRAKRKVPTRGTPVVRLTLRSVQGRDPRTHPERSKAHRNAEVPVPEVHFRSPPVASDRPVAGLHEESKRLFCSLDFSSRPCGTAAGLPLRGHRWVEGCRGELRRRGSAPDQTGSQHDGAGYTDDDASADEHPKTCKRQGQRRRRQGRRSGRTRPAPGKRGHRPGSTRRARGRWGRDTPGLALSHGGCGPRRGVEKAVPQEGWSVGGDAERRPSRSHQ